MIKIICGPKGSGKRIIDAANGAVDTAKGHLIFITDTKRYMYDLRREVRFIDVSDYSVAGEDALCGFIKGVIAGSYDNEFVYVDGVARIAGKAHRGQGHQGYGAALLYAREGRIHALSHHLHHLQLRGRGTSRIREEVPVRQNGASAPRHFKRTLSRYVPFS